MSEGAEVETRPVQTGVGRGRDLVVWAGLAANVGVAVAKFVAAAITGSSAMLTEAFHSVTDTANELLVLYGRRRAVRAADAVHPFGYGREIYFWSFVVSVLIFGLGAGFSIYEGVGHLLSPTPISDPHVSFIVLSVSALLEGSSWIVSVRAFNRHRGDMGAWRAIRVSKDPSRFIVLLEDSAALLGLAVAAAGTGASVLTKNPMWDGVSSIAIGLILAGEAAVIARESKNLLIGERADPRIAEMLEGHVRRELPSIRTHGVTTLQVGAHEVVAIVRINVGSGLGAATLADALDRARRDVQDRFPAVARVYAEFAAPQAFDRLWVSSLRRDRSPGGRD